MPRRQADAWSAGTIAGCEAGGGVRILPQLRQERVVKQHSGSVVVVERVACMGDRAVSTFTTIGFAFERAP